MEYLKAFLLAVVCVVGLISLAIAIAKFAGLFSRYKDRG